MAASKAPNLTATITILAVLVVVGLAWRSCWYATPLSDAEIERILEDEDAEENRLQKALSQIKARLDGKDASARRHLDRVAALAGHPVAQIRSTVAWVLGAAPEEPGHDAVLERLLQDAEPLVRYNAATSLGARRNPAAREVLLRMLDVTSVPSPADGSLRAPRKKGAAVRFGQIIARVERSDGTRGDVRAPLDGRLKRLLKAHGDRVTAGEALAEIEPSAGQIENALLALARVGKPDDVTAIQRVLESSFTITPGTRRLAEEAIEALRSKR